MGSGDGRAGVALPHWTWTRGRHEVAGGHGRAGVALPDGHGNGVCHKVAVGHGRAGVALPDGHGTIGTMDMDMTHTPAV